MGPVGAGKTTAIHTLSDIEVVHTEARATDATRHLKATTTVSMDVGVLHLPGNDKLRLYGAPGQDRFDFMSKTPNTPARFVDEAIESGGEIKRLLLDRANYYSTTGGHGGCRGCGEVTAIRLVMATNHAITERRRRDHIVDLENMLNALNGKLESLPLGCFAVTTSIDAEIPPGIIFCLRAEDAAAEKAIDPGYPLAPHYLVHVGEDGTVLLPYTQAKRILDRLKRLSLGRDLPDASACAQFDRATKQGEDMRHAQKLLSAAVSSIVGKSEERAIASLFSPGGTHAMKGEFAGSNDFEVLAYLVVLPNHAEGAAA